MKKIAKLGALMFAALLAIPFGMNKPFSRAVANGEIVGDTYGAARIKCVTQASADG